MRAYVYIDQLAELTPWSREAIRTMITRGVFKQGVHFFKPLGRYGRPIFSWQAVKEFIENGGKASEPQNDRIRFADGSAIDLDEAAAEVHRMLR